LRAIVDWLVLIHAAAGGRSADSRQL